MVSATPVAAETVGAIDSYGVYVVADKGYVKVEPYSRDYSFVDFNFLNEIPSVTRGSDTLKLVVYEKNFSPDGVELALRPLDTKVRIQKIKFRVEPMKKADMYELTVDSPVKDGTMLHVRAWAFFDNMGVVMLGDTQEELVKYFSQKQLPKAPIVVQYLDDALRAFPENPKLKELSAYWKKAAEAEKDKEAYAYVEEKWHQYEQAEKLALKQRYLEAVIVEINGYLNEHPNGHKVEEAKKRKAAAEEKLKEYEKLL
jgi:hypothetical protein